LCYDYIRKKANYKSGIAKFMKNIPRIFLGDTLRENMVVPATKDAAHYLTRVMRTNKFLAFGGGREYFAEIDADGKNFHIGNATSHTDPSGDATLYFAPIKKTDDLVNMATQSGTAKLVPVITDRTTTRHINWDRMRKIAIEAAEQSNRNSVPEITAPVKFADLDLSKIAFADERAAHGRAPGAARCGASILVGPEGGFSDAEFAALDAAGACGISLGRTILRAELAAAVAVLKISE